MSLSEGGIDRLARGFDLVGENARGDAEGRERLERHPAHVDVLRLVDVYPASEDPIEGISSESLARAIAERGHEDAAWIGDVRSAGERLAREVRPGDVVLTLGAGNVHAAGDELLRRLRA